MCRKAHPEGARATSQKTCVIALNKDIKTFAPPFERKAAMPSFGGIALFVQI